MSSIADITFLRPFWFAAIPVLAVLMFWRLRRSGQPGDWQASIQPHLLAAMTAMGRIEPAGSQFFAVVPFVIAMCVAVALTGPSIEKRGAQTFRNLDGVVFVIDVSGSMVRGESWPSVVNMAHAGLSALGGKPAALIVYGGDSYLASPLTTDHRQLAQSISLIDENLMPDRGNRPHLALERAADLLQNASVLSGDVVLMTDGEGLSDDATAAAMRLTELGARLSVVAAKTTVSGNPPISPATFESLVSVGGGQIYETPDLIRFMEDFGDTAASRTELQDLQLVLRADIGRYLLFLALLPALLLFRRSRA